MRLRGRDLLLASRIATTIVYTTPTCDAHVTTCGGAPCTLADDKRHFEQTPVGGLCQDCSITSHHGTARKTSINLLAASANKDMNPGKCRRKEGNPTLSHVGPCTPIPLHVATMLSSSLLFFSRVSRSSPSSQLPSAFSPHRFASQ